MNQLEFVFKFRKVHGTMYFVHDFWLYICLLSCKNKIDPRNTQMYQLYLYYTYK